jgi:hypothetical protein
MPGDILNEDNNHPTHIQERIKNANKTYFILQNFSKIKTYPKKIKIHNKEHNNGQHVNICI